MKRLQEEQPNLPWTEAAGSLPADATLWLIAAKRGDARHMRAHLLAASSDDREVFFVYEGDGAPALTSSSIVGIHDEGVLALFAPASFGGANLAGLVHSALVRRSALHRPQASLTDLLLIRLWGNGQTMATGSYAHGPLGQGLARIQTSDLRANPYIVRSIAQQLSAALAPNASSLRALLRRNAALACVEAADRIPGGRRDMLLEALSGFQDAARDFQAAGLGNHADRSDQDAEVLRRFLRIEYGNEPFLPGLDVLEPRLPEMQRSAFRSYRCLGACIPLDTGGAWRETGPATQSPSVLVEAGVVPVRGLRLEEILSRARRPALVPRVRAMSGRSRDPRQRFRVWLDEEHKALLNLPMGKPRSDGPNFIISVTSRGRPLDPPFHEMRPGRPADFFATSTRAPEHVTVHVASQGRKGSYRVPVA